MTLYQVAVKPAIQEQASFQVNEVAGLPVTNIGLTKGFSYSGHFMFSRMDLHYRQANTIVADALICFKFLAYSGFYPDMQVAVLRDEFGDKARLLDDTSKHSPNI